MGNPVVGTCACPLCREPGAEVRQGAKGALYIVCDECVSQVRTMSRKGRRCIQERSGASLAPPPEEPAATAAPSSGEGDTPAKGEAGTPAGPAADAPPAGKPKDAGGKWYEVYGVRK